MPNLKQYRTAIACLVLFIMGFVINVSVLGGDWSGQLRYLLTLLGLLATIVACAVVLVVLFKLVGRLWDALVARQDASFDADPDQPDEPPSKQ